MARVFICYSRLDISFVNELVRDLKAGGINTWRDVDDIPSDIRANTSSWRDAVERGLRESSHMVVVLSPNSISSQEVKAEWNYFLGQGRSVYPILFLDCDIPYRLYSLNYYDFRSNYHEALAGLLPALPKGGSDDIMPVGPLPMRRGLLYGIIAAALILILTAGAIGASSGLFSPIATATASSGSGATGAISVSPTEAATELGTPAQPLDPLIISIGNLSQLELQPPLTGHTDYIRAVAWSPDGKRLASASRDGTIILWTIATGESRVLTGHSDWVNDVAWSPPITTGDPGGLRLMSAGSDSRIIEWDTTNGRVLRTLTGQEGAIYDIAWSPDGKLVASGADDHTLVVRNSASGQIVQTLRANSPVFAAAWSPDSALVASGEQDGTVHIWDVASGQTVQTLKGHTGSVYSLAWSNGSILASGSADTTVIIWDTISGTQLFRLTGHSQQVYGVAWSPDDRLLASVSADRGLMIWNAADGSPLRRILGHLEPVTSVAWSPDGKMIATGSWDMNVALWEIKP